MTKDNQSTAPQSRVLSGEEVEIYQRVTGNEGPSPLMKRYLKSRKKERLMKSVGGGPEKMR